MAATVETSYGTVEGIQNKGHQAFLVIPFARPPVGELRFRAPQPPDSWEGARETKKFSASSFQGRSAVVGMAAEGPLSEDCLYLNVYTPRSDNAKRPVMFWVHGGGFTLGSADSPIYHGGFLPERGDVVLVTINYRLGALGYLYLGDHGGKEWGASANCGQLDQIAALEWVQANIASFGGDPENVTIFGQSAGGVAVVALMGMPKARGLFHRVIAQSGTGANLQLPEHTKKLTEAFLSELDIEPDASQTLQEIPADDIITAQQKVIARLQTAGLAARLSPVVDGDTLPIQPFEAVGNGEAGDISLMVGNNRDEVKQFKDVKNIKPIPDEELEKIVETSRPRRTKAGAAEIISVYKQSRAHCQLPTDNVDMEDAVNTDVRFRLPGLQLAEIHGNTHVYLFTWESPARRGAMGACHSLEMPFVFGTLHHPLEVKFTGSGPDADRLSENMMDSWISFARTGDPNHENLNGWVAYDSNQRATMIFGRESGIADAPFEEERAIWEQEEE